MVLLGINSIDPCVFRPFLLIDIARLCIDTNQVDLTTECLNLLKESQSTVIIIYAEHTNGFYVIADCTKVVLDYPS